MLAAENVCYSYKPGAPVLHKVSLVVEARSVVFLLGHNGCGKTTLLEILSGVRAPDAGQVRLNGIDLHRLPAHKRAQRIGLVPQVHTPVFAYDVRQVVLMGRTPHLGWLSTPDHHDLEIVDHAIDLVGLAALRDRPYTDLSGGERQLAMIARGLAQQTDILLLDEPASHLDPRNRQQVFETVSALAEQHALAFVITSHNPNSALLYAHQIAVMKGGQVVAAGIPSQVLTEETLTASYEIDFEVIYDDAHRARAIMPRRNGRPNT